MAEDASSSAASSPKIPFPTLTIIYVPDESGAVAEEVSQKYPNVTVEECLGYFHGSKRQYKKVTIWSQGIDSLWLDAIIGRTKELASVDFVTEVSGGMMYVL
jgi:hypothetical protein